MQNYQKLISIKCVKYNKSYGSKRRQNRHGRREKRVTRKYTLRERDRSRACSREIYEIWIELSERIHMRGETVPKIISKDKKYS